MRTFCEHFLCDGVHQGDTTGVWVLLESEPVLDFPHGPNALVMRRSVSSNLRGGSTFLARFGAKCEHFAYMCARSLVWLRERVGKLFVEHGIIGARAAL